MFTRRLGAVALATLATTVVVLVAACGGGESPRQASRPATAKQAVLTVSEVAYDRNADGTHERLTVYAPVKGGPWPTAVMIHGGGNSRLDMWAESVASHGAVVFVPYWPDNAPWPTAKAFHADATSISARLACAVRFARATAERYGGDPESLTLFGWSAGANNAAVIAFADPPVSKGCAAAAGSIVPDNLVLFDADWVPGAPFWDDLRREDPTVLERLVPWRQLESGTRMPVHLLESADPSLCVEPPDMAGWLALRDPDGHVHETLERLGALRDGRLCLHEVEQLGYEQLKTLGHDVTYRVLPGSTHEFLSKAALRIVATTILGPGSVPAAGDA